MQCKNCGGSLVLRETIDYPIDESGTYWRDEDAHTTAPEGVYCTVCGAGHKYEQIHGGDGESRTTVALTVNSDPTPVATIAIGFRGGVVDDLASKQFVGLIAIDEDRQEVGMFLATPEAPNPWLDRAWELSRLIKRGEWSASFADIEEA